MAASLQPGDDGWELVFPDLFVAVDEAAAKSQKKLLRLRKAEFVSLAVGAAVSEIPRSVAWGAGPFLTVLLFLVAFFLRVTGSDQDAERTWYDSRAAAESCKSISWQYSVGGEAFRIDEVKASQRFSGELKSILSDLHELDQPTVSGSVSVITPTMRTLRSSPLPARSAAYKRLRVNDQLVWYQNKAKWNGVRATWWRRAMIATEAIAALLGFGRVVGWFDVDWLSILAALAAVLAAWQQTKNYVGLSQSYAVTSHDVSLASSSLDEATTEEDWAQAVHDAEAAFSREHTVWRARRQGPITS